MKMFRRVKKSPEAPVASSDPSTGPRLSAVTAWALAHGVPYSHVVPEFLEDVCRDDEQTRRPGAEDVG